MTDSPLLEFDSQPEGIDTKGDDGKKSPEKILTQQLDTMTIKGQLSAIDIGMLTSPFLHPAMHGREKKR